MNIKNVTVAGSGVLGYQIAFQVAYSGFEVTVYDINDEAIEKAKSKFDIQSEHYKRDLQSTEEQLQGTFNRLKYSSDLAQAVKDADLVIEAVPENPSIKIDFYTKLKAVAPAHTIFATNSSTMLPSQFAEYTGRPELFIALHFANNIWTSNTAEVMGHPGTSKETFETLLEFAKNIGMVVLPLYKEQPGYILNTLLVPFIGSALHLLVHEVADAATIDKTWMVATGAPSGPCAILDIVGFNTVYNITSLSDDSDPNKQLVLDYVKTNFIDQNKLGVATGEGLYKYPSPAYLEPDFLK